MSCYDVNQKQGLRALLAGGATEQILCHLSGFRHTPGIQQLGPAFAQPIAVL